MPKRKLGLEEVSAIYNHPDVGNESWLINEVAKRNASVNTWGQQSVDKLVGTTNRNGSSIAVKRNKKIGLRPNNKLVEMSNTTKVYRQPQVQKYKISDENLVKLNIAEHLAKIRSYNTDTPGEYAPNGYTMGKLGFNYADNTQSKYQYKENGKKVYQCAYTANRLSSRFRRPTAGNAWTTQGIYGDSTLIDGYNQGINIRPPFYVQPLVDLYNRKAADYVKNHIAEHNLQDGDIVGMYTAFSPSQKRAYREGLNRRTNTHTGRIVTGLDGAPFVVHNMHGEVRVDPLSELLGGGNGVGVTYISRPNLTPQANRERSYSSIK